MIEVIYKGKDITSYISINKCIHDMYAEGRSDTLFLRLNDTAGLWDKWQPQTGDDIAVNYGNAKTGKMFVFSCSPTNGLYTIKAMSVPPTYREKNSKTWQKVKLTQIGSEIAAKHGLSFKSYGVTDYLYEYILQDNQSDFAFLHNRCILEGCSFVVYDGVLTIYSQTYMESQQASEVFSFSSDTDFEFWERTASCYGSCEIERGAYKGSFTAGNGLAAVLRPNDNISIGSNDEAVRFAKNLLRNANKNAKTGYIRAVVLTGYAPASNINMKNARAATWNGQAFVTQVRNDYGDCTSKIFFRKALEGY